MRIVLIVAVAMLVAPARAATLKPMATLHAPVVRLKDLFANAGPDSDRVLGPGPGPGGQIVVESSQLAYIAHRFGVDWQPASTADRAVLDRPGRPLSRAEVLVPLRAALAASGVGADAEIALADFTPPLVPLEGGFAAVATSLQYDAASGHFSALVTVTGPTIEPISTAIAGRAEATVLVPVAVTRLPAGTVIGPDDLHIARVRVSQIGGEIVRQPAQAIGLQLREQIAAGQPVPRAELVRPELVKKGARVLMLLDSPGLAVTAEGLALDAGGEGELIRVQNPISHAVVEAEVLADGSVRVAPGAMPLVPVGVRRTITLLGQ
jgi:flagella basal body P-ring formation protein FlgA